jgi:ribosomal protein S1
MGVGMSISDTRLKTPSEVLAEKVVAGLVAKALVLSNDAKKLTVNISTGKLKAEDWRLVIEKAIDKDASNG